VQFGIGATVSPLVGVLGNDATAMALTVGAGLALGVLVLVTVVRPWQLSDLPDTPTVAVAH
jgi:DHA1 family bicyclomycin/chloramphenicol resistance-like MFS transporter